LVDFRRAAAHVAGCGLDLVEEAFGGVALFAE
jgi:hypothetical protein